MYFLIGNINELNNAQIIRFLIYIFIIFIACLIFSILLSKFLKLNYVNIFLFLSSFIFVLFNYSLWDLNKFIYLAIIFLLFPIHAFIAYKKKYLIITLIAIFSMYLTTVVQTLIQYNKTDINIDDKSLTKFEMQLNKKKLIGLPNIYLIILDAYSRHDVLNEIGFDNKYFMNYLEDKNFYVSYNSRSNYFSSEASFKTIYTMDLINDDDSYVKSKFFSKIVRGENPVIKYLREMGYTHVRMGANQSKDHDCSGVEDICLFKINEILGSSNGIGKIDIHILRMTPLYPLLIKLGFFSNYMHNSFYSKSTISNAHENWKKMEKSKKPYFFQIYVWQPHGPYIHDDKCNKKKIISNISSMDFYEASQEYLDELKCVNSQLIKFIDDIDQQDKESVIILLSDHGHDLVDFTEKSIHEYSQKDINDRFANFFSIRIKNSCKKLFYNDISPVNIFRIVLGCLNETKVNLLDDKSYIHNIKNFNGFEEIILNY